MAKKYRIWKDAEYQYIWIIERKRLFWWFKVPGYKSCESGARDKVKHLMAKRKYIYPPERKDCTCDCDCDV